MGPDEATWTALAAVLTTVGAVWTVYAFRHRGVASGVRGAGLTLLPVAAWATGSLRMFAEVLDAVVDWATGLAFSPLVWVGVSLFGLAVVLLVVSGLMRSRGVGARTVGSGGRGTGRREAPASGGRREVSASSGSSDEPAADDDMAEIEELLRRRGIT